MSLVSVSSFDPPPVVRLRGLAPLSESEIRLLGEASRRTRPIAARRDVMLEGEAVQAASIVVSGWACRSRLLTDGRRQILGFLLPGDVFGFYRHHDPVAPTAVNAITAVNICDAPTVDVRRLGSGLGEAYAVSCALEEAYLFNHIVRLGRQTAYERLAHLMLEFSERLQAAGLAIGNRFPMPLTQEYLGDTLGLTSVHINRTLQQLRREQMLEAANGYVTLLEPEALASVADYKPARVRLDTSRPEIARTS